MRLRLNTYQVRDVNFGGRTALVDGRLEIDRAELSAVLHRDPNFRAVRIDLARPGDATRIIHVLDSVEPRLKVEGPGTVFPGFLGGPQVVGRGTTNRLAGVAVIATGNPRTAEGSQGLWEAILDMSGPGAVYSPLSQTANLVLDFEVKDGVNLVDAVASIRLAALKAAVYLAETTRGREPDDSAVFELGPAAPSRTRDAGLPRVVYISPVMREGDIHATYFYGEPVPNLPVFVHPNEELDGAVVSADYWHACFRSPTYYYQNNPVTRRLYQLHGRAIDFVGMILCRSLVPTELGKRRQAAQVAKLAQQLGAQGAIVTMSNGGNAYVDQMLICQECERLGINTVLGVSEYGGPDGRDHPLVVSVPEAVAMVSVGRMDEPITLPAMERVLGGESFLSIHLYERAFQARRPGDEFTVSPVQVYCATSQLGMNRLRVVPSQKPIMVASRPRDRRDGKLRIVQYLNQFFGGIGGEEQASAPVQERPGPVGPGLALAQELREQAAIVATVICGDNYFHEHLASATDEIVARLAAHQPDVVVAGPAFGAGRYGVACGAVCAAVEERLAIPAVTAMYPENPGVDLYGGQVVIVPTSDSAASMRQVVPALARLALKRASGKPLGPAEEEGYLPYEVRTNTLVGETGAERMAAMLLSRLRGEPFQSEIPVPTFDRVAPAPPLPDLSKAVVALVTEAGVVPAENPDRIESRLATKWAAYSLEQLDDLRCGEFRSVHGGFDTTEIDKDPDRVLPLDVLRDLEREGKIGKLHEKMYVTVGAAQPLARARQFGREIAQELARAGVQAAILTAT